MSPFIIHTSFNFWFKKLIPVLILLNFSVLAIRLLFAKCNHLVICRYLFKGIYFLNIGVAITALFDQFICILGFFSISVLGAMSSKFPVKNTSGGTLAKRWRRHLSKDKKCETNCLRISLRVDSQIVGKSPMRSSSDVKHLTSVLFP